MRSIIPLVLPLCFALIVQSAVIEKSSSSSGDELPTIFCAEIEFPENFTCNFEKLTSFPPYSEEGLYHLWYMDFEFPFEETSICVVSYSFRNSKSPDRLIFQYNTCLTDEKKLHYKMHETSSLMIGYLGLNSNECKFRFVYQETTDEGPLKRMSRRRSVVFRLKEYQCGTRFEHAALVGAIYYKKESIFDPKTNRERPAKSEE